MHIQKLSVIIFCAVLSSFNSAYFSKCQAQSESNPYKIQWPKGWDISELPAATTASGKDLHGRRVRAFKKDNGKVTAVIELTYIPRNDSGKGKLDEEFATAIKTIQDGYAEKGLKADISQPKGSSLAKIPDLEANIEVKSPKFVLKQYIAMALSKNYVYSLSFSGPEANFDKLKPDFDHCRKTLALY